MAEKVKNSRPRGTTGISAKHQVTIPTAAMKAAGLHAGDRLRVKAKKVGSVTLEREEHDPNSEAFGALTGVYKDFDLDALRDEWA